MGKRRVRKRTKVAPTKPSSRSEVGGGSQVISTSEHPLLNNLVLQTIFGYLEKKDLRSCREVHPTWNLEAIPHLKKRGGPVIIKTTPRMMNFNIAAYYRDFINCVATSPDFPFRQIAFSIHADLQVYGPAWTQLLNYVAPWVEEITVFVQDIGNPWIPAGIQFPNVTTLCVLEKQKLVFDWNQLTRMVESCQNLKTLELERVERDTLADLSRLEGLRLRRFLVGELRQDPGDSWRWERDGFAQFLERQKDFLTRVDMGRVIVDCYANRLNRMPKVTTRGIYPTNDYA